MRACICAQCGQPARGTWPAYAIGVIVARPSGVLHRDEHGCAASYYGAVRTEIVRRGCEDSACIERVGS